MMVDFPASGEARTYAHSSAPLTRVRFDEGDYIETINGARVRVTAVGEEEGLLVYVCENEQGLTLEIPEQHLNPMIQLNTPAERLFSSQTDKPDWFDLRQLTWKHLNRLASSELTGLTGARTSLIPHQLYIAHEVAKRFAPRVLLADEVGLGKTIEAGMIIHQQLLSERAGRVLIVVPESLQHQWLVEMLRRFNLHFTILNEQRAEDIIGEDDSINPFDSEQLVLCGLDYLTHNPSALEQAVDCSWDLLVVDEAHHLSWSEAEASPEYMAIELLARTIPGVLLLTATPEQLGKSGHFARLRLLDPDRYPSLSGFEQEATQYAPIADAIERLLDDKPLDSSEVSSLESLIHSDDNKALLQHLTADGDDTDESSHSRELLMNHLLDRHGTGRVLFRNTRNAVEGFPAREVQAHPLPLPEQYADAMAEAHQLLTPEFEALQEHADWTADDPRIDWLIAQIREHFPEKILLIAAYAETVLDLAEALRIKAGINAAVFHENLNIIERDRAAAWFADQEDGTQILLCSEIGSEGRNFQFAHHLVLFDLPWNPDLLEQRIGRLDRIGQENTIQIHVPYFEGSAGETMFRWYHKGLGAFEHTCPAGHTVFSNMHERLEAQLGDEDQTDLDALISDTAELNLKLNTELQNGRDRLLEYNSCRPGSSTALLEQAQQVQNPEALLDYLERAFDCFGIEIEDDTSTTYIVRPGNHMEDHGIPDLPEDGMKITCYRDTALANEDLRYFTWEHPSVNAAMYSVISGEKGNSTLVALEHPGIKPGTLLLECIFVLAPAAGQSSLASRYLPPTLLRVVVDKSGRNVGDRLSSDIIDEHRVKVKRDVTSQLIRACVDDLKSMVKHAGNHAAAPAEAVIQSAQQRANEALGEEINRLKSLQRVNSNVRDEEITFFENQLSEAAQMLEKARPRLDALRVVFAG